MSGTVHVNMVRSIIMHFLLVSSKKTMFGPRFLKYNWLLIECGCEIDCNVDYKRAEYKWWSGPTGMSIPLPKKTRPSMLKFPILLELLKLDLFSHYTHAGNKKPETLQGYWATQKTRWFRDVGQIYLCSIQHIKSPRRSRTGVHCETHPKLKCYPLLRVAAMGQGWDMPSSIAYTYKRVLQRWEGKGFKLVGHQDICTRDCSEPLMFRRQWSFFKLK
jgi:hypothetical protein